ncbi:apolipoprotein N-acyltransferase [uncultured Polaribacter sp.]|uniref:apolipoprotein N-acyltransferase n=1 Tax=uncultured Polaribacter sp. TaxID=174711 RepID=UPI00263261D4|nr:apolipoprotein N-acyltransferase [uncultured Polaribacter sp.]
MSILKKIPLWALSGLLYGLSWPIFENLNLSFLAWVAFVPLFIFLEKNQHKFWKSMLGSYTAMVIFGCFAAGWLFNFPQAKLQIAVIFFLEEFWFFIPFLIFFPIQKRIGFNKALWLFPFIWMLWEWTYLSLEFTMGTHLSAYSQSGNIWLIQYIDITGMWGVSFWLLLLNVFIFKAYQSVNYNLKSSWFYKKVGFIVLLMLGIPLLYAAISYSKYNEFKGKSIDVTIVPTQYSARFLNNSDNSFRLVEETLHRTDKIAFTNQEKGKTSDLYIWPETGLPFTMQQSNLSELLFEATTDWKAALLTGARGISDTLNKQDKRNYVSGALISHQVKEIKFHHKTVLTPGQEAIPYHSLLEKIKSFPYKKYDTRFYKKGEKSVPLQFTTKNKKAFLLGVSLCYEQWYPEHWAALSRNGAEFYAHLAAEGWYGKVGFMSFMTNVTRMRSIENRKQTARAANVGSTGFIDQMGRLYEVSKKGSLQIISSKLKASDEVTLYADKPNYFPILILTVFLTLLLFQIYEQKFFKLLK